MTDKDQKMLQSALWHISNSVTNGKSQTAECEITQWLKNKINSIPAEEEKLSEDSNDPKNDSDHSETFYTYEQINILANNRAQWQKEQMMKSAVDATCVILPSPDLFKVLICHEVTDKLTDKQKIKILIVKEDE